MADFKKMLETILSKGKLNQQELADKLQVSPAQITRWLGGAEPRLSNYEKIRQFYDELN